MLPRGATPKIAHQIAVVRLQGRHQIAAQGIGCLPAFKFQSEVAGFVLRENPDRVCIPFCLFPGILNLAVGTKR